MDNDAHEQPLSLSPEALARLEQLKNATVKALDIELEQKAKQYTYSFAELHKIKDTAVSYILPELIPAATLAVIIGEDGIGKTQLMIELGLHIAYKRETFLGMPLSVKHGRTLFIATEDARLKFIQAANKQASAHWPGYDPAKIDMHFTEGSDFDQFKDLKAEVVAFCDKGAPDVIIVDALSDAYTLIDGDINSSKDTRVIMGFFQGIINTYGCTVIFYSSYR